jgi:hypothetical protein
VPDVCELADGTSEDCDANGLPDDCDEDCDGNGVPDVCDLADGTSEDCDANGLPDDCQFVPFFPAALFENTTGLPDALYLIGPPGEDYNVGLGGQIVTYDFGAGIVDEPGLDLNVYEVDNGGQEFSSINVLVSNDGVSFISIKNTESALQRIPGDESLCCDQFGRSYDLAASGLGVARYVRIDGNGSGPAGGENGFDLSLVAAINGSPDCNGNGILDSCEVGDGSNADCNGNGVPDECEEAMFPSVLSGNTTSFVDGYFTNAPDDLAAGIGGREVTFDFTGSLIYDGAGPDLNVYEQDNGEAEFDAIDVLVSFDGVEYFSIARSAGPVVRVTGDEEHCCDELARSYDVATSGLDIVRFVRIDGLGDSRSGRGNGLELDAIAAVHTLLCGVPGDVTGDGVVDVNDLVAVLLAWGLCPPGPCPADSNGDGTIDVDDLLAVLLNWP